MEGLLAFFVESTFIGLWLFGRNRLPAGAYAVDLHGEDTQQPMKMAAALSGEPALAYHPRPRTPGHCWAWHSAATQSARSWAPR
jgi:hypothetical protein